MKAKGLLIAVLLSATNFAWANGGLSIDNVEQHMNASNWIDTQTNRPEITAQGPLDQFQNVMPERKRSLVDTNKFKQAYNGQS